MSLNAKLAINYWKHPEKKNQPEAYATQDAKIRCEAMALIVAKYADKDDRILEIGCNCGTTLNYLFNGGFRRLHGMDINKKAIALAKALYPAMAKETYLVSSDIKDYVSAWSDDTYNLIYTSAVLVHLPYEYDFIFAELVRLLKQGGHLILKEDEGLSGGRKFQRNYREVFESLGLKQIDSFPFELNKGYTVRIFKKVE
jgi:SAM-dependent methyltransferase